MPLKGPDEYPPKEWTCPGCGKKHSAPHYSHPNQINYELKPCTPGRVVFNRRLKDDTLDEETPINGEFVGKNKEGKQFDEDGYQRPIFCPHCGWEDDWIILIRNGELDGYVEEFLKRMNGNIKKLSGAEVVQQFMGFLKGKGVVE